MPRVVLPLLLALLLGTAAPSPAGARGRRSSAAQTLLSRGQQAFEDGHYRKAITLLERVSRQGPLGREARFVQAYAHFKLGALEPAEQLLQLLLEQRFSARVGLLAGMVAFQRRQLRRAVRLLQRSADEQREPWSSAATRLLERVNAEGQAVERRFSAALARAKQAIADGDLARAEVELGQAEQALRDGGWTRPDAGAPQPGSSQPGGHYLLHYYRGLIAYKRGRSKRACQRLQRALALQADDEWSRYMAALACHDGGDSPEGRAELTTLFRTARDREVRRAAREALKRLSRATATGQPPPRRLWLGLELGSGIDTNPAYVDELDSPLEETAVALQVGGRLAYARPLSARFGLDVGLRAMERAYLYGGSGLEQTEVAPWVGMNLAAGRWGAAVQFDYGLLLYGHEPLFSVYGASAELRLQPRGWLQLASSGRVRWRTVLDADRRYLEALEAGGAAGARLRWRWLALDLFYGLWREWSDPVLAAFTVNESRGMRGRRVETVVHTLSVDYSRLAHGPELWYRVRLPWKLSLSLGAALQWRLYVGGDTLSRETSTGPSEQQELDARRDLRLSATAELARSLPHGLWLALRFESLDNLSSLELGAPVFIDRNYSRRLLALMVGWRLAQ